MKSLIPLAAFAALSLAAASTPALAQAGNQPPVCPNVVNQFLTLEEYGEWMGFYLGPAPDPTQSKHWQSIVRNPASSNIFYLTRSGENQPGRHPNLAVLRMDSADGLTGDRLRSNRLKRATETQDTAPPTSDKIIASYEFTSHNHAGGMQIAGDILALPLEDPTGTAAQGEIIFYDISTPEIPVQLPFSIRNLAHNFGVVGFTQLADGRYLLLATYGNNTSVEFFVSQPNDLASLGQLPSCYLDGNTLPNWEICNNAGGQYCYQTLHFITQNNGQLFLGCTWNTSPAAPVVNGLDLARLYRVNLSGSCITLNYVTQRHFYCSANSTGSNGNFNAATGFYVSPSGNLLLYTTTHDNDGPSGSTSMTEFRSYNGTRTGTPASPCDAWVRLYADPVGWNSGDRGITFDAIDRAAEDYNDFNNLDGGPIPVGFTDQASSVSYCLPVGVTARLYQNDTFAGKYLDLVGNGHTQFIFDLSGVSWTSGSGNPDDQISSIQFFNAPAAGLLVPDSAATVTLATLAATGGPCAVIRVASGSYPENTLLNKNVLYKAIGGPVTIGTNP